MGKRKNWHGLCLCALLAAVLVAVALTGCSGTKTDQAAIAMIPTEKSILKDGSFNESTLEGIKRYAEESGVAYQVYEPEAKTDEQYLAAIDLAVKDGAKIIVTPGYNFETCIYVAQEKYPQVSFVLIDGVPNDGAESPTQKIGENTYSVLYSEEQAGFMAGYAIVKDGFTKLGFLGGREFPAVVAFGYGFIQGAEYAGAELGLPAGSIEIKYGYCGNFIASPQNQAQAASWYNGGTEVIFACGGAIGLSVIAAAEADTGKWVIGVDRDQSADSPVVITSAMKMIANSVYLAIDSYHQGAFPGGQSVHLGVDVDGVGIAIDTARFRSFTKADYDVLYDKLISNSGGLTDGIKNTFDGKITDIPFKYITIVDMTM